jgi:hypothetical protein
MMTNIQSTYFIGVLAWELGSLATLRCERQLGIVPQA